MAAPCRHKEGISNETTALVIYNLYMLVMKKNNI
jgi:hypothetical protein